MVFAIVGELEDIQKLTERSQLKKRMEVVSRQKVRRVQLTKRHAQEMADRGQHASHSSSSETETQRGEV